MLEVEWKQRILLTKKKVQQRVLVILLVSGAEILLDNLLRMLSVEDSEVFILIYAANQGH